MDFNKKVDQFKIVLSSKMSKREDYFNPIYEDYDSDSDSYSIKFSVCPTFGYEISTFDVKFTVMYDLIYSGNIGIPIQFSSIGPMRKRFTKSYIENYTDTNEILKDFIEIHKEWMDIKNEKNKELKKKKLESFIKIHEIEADFN
jgi:hypothetical protein